MLLATASFILIGCWSADPPTFPRPEIACELDAAQEADRAASASIESMPTIQTIRVNSAVVWNAGDADAPIIRAGDEIILEGSGFGRGPDVDFAKIMIGNSRVLETDLQMYEQRLDILNQINYETTQADSTWDRDILSWSDARIRFRVPVHASRGPLVIQEQKRVDRLESLVTPGEPHLVLDALTERIADPGVDHVCDVVSVLSEPVQSHAISVVVENPDFETLVTRGRQAFWSYDYNIGTSHSARNLDWRMILRGGATDPMTGEPADPLVLFGAYSTNPVEVPKEAIDDVFFDRYPQPSPIPGFLGLQPATDSGMTRNTGFVGYRYAESNHPLFGPGEWIGFNCASCHGVRINYERSPGVSVTRVFPGLPNPRWSMKWALLDEFEGIRTLEGHPNRASAEPVDKTALIYSVPQGAAEHNIVRQFGDGHETDNDYQFSPIAIPNVTHFMAMRRPLSHTESYVGFEGSYIHAQAPDGATGSMRAEWLQALTAYMTTLDEHDDELRNVGLYRWLKHNRRLDEQAGDVGEGEFVETTWESYAGVRAAVERGRSEFDQSCASCHADNFGTFSNENMIRLDRVGRFFTPTIYHRETQSIRTGMLRNLYWVQLRGLLSDGHVRNLEDLVNPARCEEGSALYNNYYTLHPPIMPSPGGPDHLAPFPEYNRKGDVYRVPRLASNAPGDLGARRNRFIERHKYFVTVPWDPDFYYWDYQTMRAEYGPDELRTTSPIGMPAAPHPWCASDESAILDLVEYLLTL